MYKLERRAASEVAVYNIVYIVASRNVESIPTYSVRSWILEYEKFTSFLEFSLRTFRKDL